MVQSQDFVSNTASFLKNNLFIPFFSAHEAGSGVPGVTTLYVKDGASDELFGDRSGTGPISRFKKDKAITVRSVRLHNKYGGDPVKAYWLPYDRDKIYPLYLEDDADVMFTPVMDGCSFRISNYSNGPSLAMHANVQTDKGTVDEGMLRSMLRGEGRSLHKSDYMKPVKNYTGVAKVSMVGVRKDGKWRMYAQSFLKLDSSYRFVGVKEL